MSPSAAAIEADSPTRVIAVTSNKGGVGKTTLAANLAVYLRALREDLPVLIMSFDEQRLAERMFALESGSLGRTVLDGMRSGDLGPAIRLGQYGVHFVPSDPKIAALKQEMPDAFVLRRVLERGAWPGVVIVDTKSDLEILTRNAIAASDLALVLVSDRSSLEEAEKVFDLLDELGRPRDDARIVLSLIDLRVKYREGEHEDILALLLSEIRRRGLPLFEGFISRSPKIEALYTNTETRALPVLHGARGSLIHRQMRVVADYVLEALDRRRGTRDAPAGDAFPSAPGQARPEPSEAVWGRPLLSVDEILADVAVSSEPLARPSPETWEKRRHARCPYRRELPAFQTEEPGILALHSENLSEGGLAVESRVDLPQGNLLHVMLDDGGDEASTGPLLVWARVVQRTGRCFGLAFESHEPAVARRIAGLCSSLRGGDGVRE